MRKLPISLVKPGMTIARPVYNCDGQILLHTGMHLNSRYISRLRHLGIPALYVEDDLLQGVEVSDVISDETRVHARRALKQLHVEVATEVNLGHPPEINAITTREIIDLILSDILSDRDLVVNLTDIRSSDDYTFAHSVNVCVLSLLTGVALGLNRHQLTSLGIGSLLHDIGKTKVPREVLNKPGRFSDYEFCEMQRHTVFGFDILRTQKELSLSAAHVAYEHHERFNGEGYPRGLRGHKIHLFARIAGLVDVYDALISNRVYRKGYLPHEAIEMIYASGDYLFDYRIVRAFLDCIAAYPTGTVVELSDGRVAVVTGTLRGHSHRPNIRVVSFHEGAGEVVDEIKLCDHTSLIISRVISPEEFERLQGMENVAEM